MIQADKVDSIPDTTVIAIGKRYARIHTMIRSKNMICIMKETFHIS